MMVVACSSWARHGIVDLGVRLCSAWNLVNAL